jgi:hypothetical protein
MVAVTSWDKLAIINLAFNKLNKSSVNDLVNSGVFASSASNGFDLLYPSCISSKSWRFATKIQLLDVLPTPPPIAWWRYQLQMPSDYLAAVRTYPTIDFQIYQGNIMYTNTQEVSLEYRFLPDPTRLPAYFVHYFAIIIAAWYADTVASDEKLSAKLLAEAQDQLGEALFTDSQSHPIHAMGLNPLTQARYGGWYNDDLPGSPNTTPNP